MKKLTFKFDMDSWNPFVYTTFLFALLVILYQLTHSFWLFLTFWAAFLVPIRHRDREFREEKKQRKEQQNK